MKLKQVPGDSTRPIMDKVKQALFNIVGSDIHGADFLDLYAGTGSVGIEALSRGAGFAHFNELNPRAIKTIRENLQRTNLNADARITRCDALDLLARKPDRKYQFIYVAPPQYKDLWLRTLEVLDRNVQWRHAHCQVIIQIDPSEYDGEQRFVHLEVEDIRKYGRTMLVFYRFGERATEVDA